MLRKISQISFTVGVLGLVNILPATAQKLPTNRTPAFCTQAYYTNVCYELREGPSFTLNLPNYGSNYCKQKYGKDAVVWRYAMMAWCATPAQYRGPYS